MPTFSQELAQQMIEKYGLAYADIEGPYDCIYQSSLWEKLFKEVCKLPNSDWGKLGENNRTKKETGGWMYISLESILWPTKPEEFFAFSGIRQLQILATAGLITVIYETLCRDKYEDALDDLHGPQPETPYYEEEEPDYQPHAVHLGDLGDPLGFTIYE